MNNKLLETLADIAYIAGERQFFTGDSRFDVSSFILWAEEFENEHGATDWDQNDYRLEIERFTLEKLEAESSLIG